MHTFTFANGYSGSYTKMSSSMRKKSSKPSQTNLTKPLLKCRVINIITKCSYVLSAPSPHYLHCKSSLYLQPKANTKCKLKNPFIWPIIGYLYTIYKLTTQVPKNVNTNVQLKRRNSNIVKVRYILHFLNFVEIFSIFQPSHFLSCTHLSPLIYS